MSEEQAAARLAAYKKYAAKIEELRAYLAERPSGLTPEETDVAAALAQEARQLWEAYSPPQGGWVASI